MLNNDQIRIAACVTLYNSSINCLECISTYQNQVLWTYIIDNSTNPDTNLVKSVKALSNATYVFNGGNKGVAGALNQAAALAITDKFDYLLTMDDDTRMPVNGLFTMRHFLKTYPYTEQVGILSGVHTEYNRSKPFKIVPYTMTSGNLLNLRLYEEVGPFRDDLFIDHVDHEYGLRLTKAGYEVIELPTVYLQHELGERKRSGWGQHTFISHSPLRTYYIVRNGWVVARQFPDFRSRAFVLITKEWVKALLFEDDKMQRLSFFAAGLVDGWKRKLGKYNRAKLS